uniref:Uncharacterized protein n=1 Tax=Schistosoma curassoni TaxID=6186 RepID=A0A183L603_9TREM
MNLKENLTVYFYDQYNRYYYYMHVLSLVVDCMYDCSQHYHDH